ncbi:hypothetical protein HY605_05685 [Candidatus Peregrinibacteria bacterium]|nr:hypothetical protein [Candidatus Peregrinibacteria bacterium]
MLEEQNIPDSIAGELHVPADRARRYPELVQMLARLEGVNLSRNDLVAASVTGAAVNMVDTVFDGEPIELSILKGRAMVRAVTSEHSNPEDLPSPVTRAVQIARSSFNAKAQLALQSLMRAQLDSVEQRRPGISVARVAEITRRKATFNLLAAIANPDRAEDKQGCFEELAYLLQLVDDYADRGSDLKNGIHTLVTMSPFAQTAIIMIQKQLATVKHMFEKAYARHKLSELFSFIDRFLASAGIFSASKEGIN